LLILCALLGAGAAGGAPPYGLESRPAFAPYNNGQLVETAPVVTGSWSTVIAYPNLPFLDALGVLPMPGSNQLVVWEREGRVYSFVDSATTSAKTLMLDLSDRCQGWDDMGLLSLAFHPNFVNNHYVYLWYNWVPPGTVVGDATTRPDQNISTHQRLARFTYQPATGKLDPASEYILIDQVDHHSWHNGGGMFFHPRDGFLYLTNGNDNATQNDQTITGGFFGCLLRIDVDKRGGVISQPPTLRAQEEVGPNWPNAYYVPKSNPFVNSGQVLKEIFALGLRSPDHATYDPVSRRIFISDVGESSYEELNLIEPTDPGGLNFQWSQIEGLHGDLVPPYIGVNKRPILDYDHGQGNAVIGGYVYRGSQFPDLYGKYIFGDNVFGTIWYMDETHGLAPAGKVALATLPDGPGPKSGANYLGLSAFGYDTHGELLMCQMSSVAGHLYKLARSGAPTAQMPLTLSETGVFSNLADLTPSTGFTAYDVNTPLWSDGAHKARWMAIPDGEAIGYASSGEWTFPNGSVFVKHFELPIDETDPSRIRRLETRILVRDATGYVYGGSYKWRTDNSDADLVINAVTEDITIAEAGGDLRVQPWFFPGRQDCRSCHTRGAGGVLGLNTPQSNRDHLFTESGLSDNQLRAWNHAGYFSPALDEATLPTLTKFYALDDASATIEQRARSYLDANCAHCHRPGEAPAFWDARIELPLSTANIINGPVSNALGVIGARVIVPGDLTRSILHKRLGTATATYKMPPLAKNTVDTAALALIDQWIGEVQTPPVMLLPAPWQQADLGTLSTPGGATSGSANAFTLHSTGDDIGGTIDAFHYVYRDLSGDGIIAARITALSSSPAAAKAGVMIRESLTDDAAQASTVLTPGGSALFQHRDGVGADTASSAVTASAPYWVAIRRSGNEFISARSLDGVVWQEIGRQTIAMAANVKVGLCVTAHDPANECAAAFENVSFQPGVTFILTAPTRSQIVRAGAPATFAAGVFGDAPTSYQWRRNGVAIANATAAGYTIPAVSLGQAGSYTALLNGKVATAAGALAVVGEPVYNPNIPAGGTATIGLSAAGTGLVFRWAKDGVPLAGAAGGKAVLTLAKFSAAMAGDYSCTVTAGALSEVLGPYPLRLLNKPILTTAAPDPTFIGGAFRWALTASEPATTYTVTGLPTGLVYIPKTGVVSGQARVSGTFTVTVTPHNAAGIGKAQSFTIQIGSLPAGLAGGYGGLIDPSPEVNSGLGGRFSFNVTSSGMVTGKLFHGGAITGLVLTGQVLALDTGEASVTFLVKRGTLPPLTLVANLAAGGASLTGGLTLGGQTAALQGRHDLAAASAALLAATYNAILRPSPVAAGDPPKPPGAGRSRIVISPTGAASVTGFLSDGNSFSFGTNLDNQSTLPLHAGVYGGLGSVRGLALVAPTATLREITSTLDWRKLATPTPRSYPAAFTTTTALLGREYQAPAGSEIYLNLPNAPANAVVEFTGATLDTAAQGARTKQTFRLSAGQAVFAAGATNPCKVAMTVYPSVGCFTGSFTLKDGLLPRTVSYAGIFVPGEPTAFGYFRLPRLPALPQPATVPLTTPVDSGLVEVRAAP
jgi:uncharacterized repeat protein (TIGR03806 family)